MNKRFQPVPHLFNRVILGRIWCKMEEFHFGMTLGKCSKCFCMMNRGIVENQCQSFSACMSTKLMEKIPKRLIAALLCAFPVKTIVFRRVCPKYRAPLAFRRCCKGKKAVRACSSRESHKGR